MNNYLLDTNICVFYLRNKYGVDEKLKMIGGLRCCYVSEITILELKYGAELSDRVNENRETVEDFAKKIMVLPINMCFDIFAKEKARLRISGNIIDDFDLLIGCTAVATKLIMVTDNEQHFNRINNIAIENWITH